MLTERKVPTLEYNLPGLMARVTQELMKGKTNEEIEEIDLDLIRELGSKAIGEWERYVDGLQMVYAVSAEYCVHKANEYLQERKRRIETHENKLSQRQIMNQ